MTRRPKLRHWRRALPDSRTDEDETQLAQSIIRDVMCDYVGTTLSPDAAAAVLDEAYPWDIAVAMACDDGRVHDYLHELGHIDDVLAALAAEGFRADVCDDLLVVWARRRTRWT